jgi:hypothetical protein
MVLPERDALRIHTPGHCPGVFFSAGVNAGTPAGPGTIRAGSTAAPLAAPPQRTAGVFAGPGGSGAGHRQVSQTAGVGRQKRSLGAWFWDNLESQV